MKNFISELSPLVIISLSLFLLSFLIQVYFYSIYFGKIFFQKVNYKLRNRTDNNAVSVIICARNEAENLKRNLPLILEQDYNNFEVIVVNDRSEDETAEVLNYLATKYRHLKISAVRNDPKFTYGKKLALMLGIKASANEWLLLTDADCIPASKDWLSLMQRNFSQKTEIVLGYGGYKKEPGLLNLIIRFETAFTALFYLGLAKAGKPYMGVGRNLAYRKSLFYKNNGFASHTGLASGDDDLFINETATSENTVIEMHPDSFTWSSAEKRFVDWYRQKKRHLTTGSRYKTGSKYRLIIENISRIFLLISFVILLSKHTLVNFILIAFVSFLIYKLFVFKIFFSRLNEKYLFLPSLILESLIPYFYSFLHYRNFIDMSQNKWK